VDHRPAVVAVALSRSGSQHSSHQSFSYGF